MADARIPYTPLELAEQCEKAADAIALEVVWPADAPGVAPMDAHAAALRAKKLLIDSLEAQLAVARAAMKDTLIPAARADMAKIDAVTDAKYGPGGEQKNSFGLPPKKSGAGVSNPGGGVGAPLGQVVITKLSDGPLPQTIHGDFPNVPGAQAYEVQWATDPGFTTIAGSMTVTFSEFTAAGLVKGTEYWFRVRAVAGSRLGAWSDPAHRVANV